MKKYELPTDILITPQDLFSLIDLGKFFENINAGVMLLDASGRIVYINRAQREIDELNNSEIIGAFQADIYPAEADNTSLISEVLIQGEALSERAIMYQNPSGTVIHSLFSIFPVLKNSEIHGLVCFSQKFGPAITPDQSRLAPSGQKSSSAQAVTLIGRHPLMLRAISIARTAAATPSPIMLCGETGTGKEVFARNIHCWSHLSARPYVAVNCAAIPDTLAESILFGTAKGSFTGATETPGLFEQANGGILFLDEIDSMPLELQPKLLRVIQEMKVRRVGSSVEKSIMVKIITAAGTSAENILLAKKLRADLYYRLGVNIIEIPPLRERLSDMTELINHLILKLNYKLGQRFKGVAPEVMKIFNDYRWPGNIRELEHALESCMNSALGQFWITDKMLPSYFFKPINPSSRSDTFQNESPPQLSSMSAAPVETSPSIDSTPQPPPTQASNIRAIKDISEESEKHLILTALRKTYGNVTFAAKELGISRQLMHYKMKKFDLRKNDGRE